MAKCWLPIDTVSAGMMVRVSGTRRVMRVPSPGLLSTSTMPPIRSTLERTTSMPTPRPEIAVTSLGGRQARPRRSAPAARAATGSAAAALSSMPAAIAFSTSFLPSMPRPSSWMSIRIWLPDWRAETRQDADLALAGLQPLGRGLDAVIDRVADDVGQGIADHLDHLAVELDVAALDIDQHLLAELGRQVADHARQADEQILDPLHAGAGDRVAHFGDDRRQPLERAVDRRRRLGVSRSRRASSLRASTMSETPLITRSSSSTDRRMVRGAAILPCASATVAGDRRTARLRRPAASASISALSSPAGHFLAGLDRGDHFADAVDDREHRADQRGHRRWRRPARTSASASSAAWLSASRRGNSKKPQLPLTVWTKRKIESRRARSSGSASQATISPPRASSISRHSATKSAIRSSIGGSVPALGVERLMPPRS